ncbi:NADPH-dependent F420 reductase [Nocardiopsis sp. B62]|uniref:NADPH-dependent F420 reductase n=1 Tax=Nocardiopsis sp. B62 TaxID=2824874 RepID=UPI001B35C7F2|nr:NADPH-dependent F420 reductase [Nocardiopsis sp. B62]MBQ1079942.1 NADPH-dependent F420 reductase [Nocardiopsis sp. B62]
MAPASTRVSIIGSGDMGSAVAHLAASAGMEVFLSNSRGPDSLKDLACTLGPRVHPASTQEAIEAGEIIVISIPFSRYPVLPCGLYQGKLVIDATNYIPFRDAATTDELTATPSEVLQQHLADAKVVKAFSNIYSGHLRALARLTGAPDRSALPVAGDDPAAKTRAAEFLDRIGWDAVDAGPLSRSVLFDVGTPVFVNAYMDDPSGSDEEWGKRMTIDPGRPLGKEDVRRLL